MPHGSNKNKTVNKVSKAFDTTSILYLDNTLSTYDKLFFFYPHQDLVKTNLSKEWMNHTKEISLNPQTWLSVVTGHCHGTHNYTKSKSGATEDLGTLS